MVNGISSNAASYAGGNTQADTVQQAQGITGTQGTAKATSPDQDSVRLSTTAQAKLMLHQGMSVKQIAANLGLSVKAVSSSLGLTTTSSVAPVAVPQSNSATK